MGDSNLWSRRHDSLLLTVFSLVAVAVTLLYLSPIQAAHFKPGEIRVVFPTRGVALAAEVADTEEKQARGLGGRDDLPDGRGMLFVSDQENRSGYWMKDMRFPIDILWFDSRFRLVSFAQNITPDSYPKVFHPTRPAQYGLEVPAGFVSRNRIGVGDVVNVLH